jgi:ribonuclease P protein component
VRAADIRRVRETGRDLRGERVILCVAPGSGRCAVIATRRVGSAVERNRARRILRAAWRALEPEVEGAGDVVLVARPAIRGAKTQDLVAEMSGLLKREGGVRP